MIDAGIRALLAVTLAFAASVAGAAVDCSGLTATAANAGPVCSNSPVILHGSSNQSGVTYSWTGPNTWFSIDQNPTAPGPGTYFLQVSNAGGCRAYANTTVDAVTPPQMTLAGSVTQACGGETYTVTVDDSSSFTNFDWEASGATILSGQGTPTVTVQAENYNVLATVFVRGDHVATGCKTSPALSYRVDVDPRYSAEITAPTSGCPSAVHTASVPATFNASYNWSIVNGTITTYTGHSIEFVSNGNGDVSVTATVYNNMATCASTDTAVIAIDGPTANAQADLAICPGSSTSIPVALSGSVPFTITWNDGLVQSGIGTTQAFRNVSPIETTLYSITAVSDSICAGKATGSALVTVQIEPEILEPPQNVVIHSGAKTTLSVVAAGSNLTYSWYEGQRGDRSHLVASGTAPDFETPALKRTTRYWVEAVSECGASESPAATIAVMGRQRSTRH